MSCDDELTEEYTAGADWVFWFTLDTDLSDGDVADWEDLIVDVKDVESGALLATSQGDEPTVFTTGAFDGEANEVPATDFSAGIVTWVVFSETTATWGGKVVTVQAWTRKGGPDGPFFTETYVVSPAVAVRLEEGS